MEFKVWQEPGFEQGFFMYYDNNTYCNSSICSFLTKNKQEIFQNVLLIVTKQYHKCTVFKPSFL